MKNFVIISLLLCIKICCIDTSASELYVESVNTVKRAENLTVVQSQYCPYTSSSAVGNGRTIRDTYCYSDPCFSSNQIYFAASGSAFTVQSVASSQNFCWTGHVKSKYWFYTNNRCWIWAGATSLYPFWNSGSC